jgi:hypothetical protein
VDSEYEHTCDSSVTEITYGQGKAESPIRRMYYVLPAPYAQWRRPIKE